VENVTDRTSNPFGMRIPGGAVYGYGDVNADFHVVGDGPLRHGGLTTGVPFTDSVAGVRLQRVLAAVGLAADPYAEQPRLSNTYLSYLHPTVGGDAVTGDPERFLDAELRAINAHILLVVGDRPLEYALREHTSRWNDLPHDASALHAEEIRGRGFLVVPVADPNEWTPSEERALTETLRRLLDSDYRQTKGVATTVG
jgi:uracil-DNA glycosylase